MTNYSIGHIGRIARIGDHWAEQPPPMLCRPPPCSIGSRHRSVVAALCSTGAALADAADVADAVFSHTPHFSATMEGLPTKGESFWARPVI
jgi:hypothetical protein